MVTWSLVYYWSEWVIRLVMLVYVPTKRSAAAARSWLLFIFLLPWPGMIAYALIGRPYLPRRRVALQARLSELIRDEQARRVMPGRDVAPPLPPEFAHVKTLAQNLGDFLIFPGNRIELLDDYDGAIDRLVADIEAATHHIHLLYYIFADDATGRRVGDALVAAVGRGVTCRVLMDGRGSKSGLRRLAPRLRMAGVEVVAVMPSRLWRQFTK